MPNPIQPPDESFAAGPPSGPNNNGADGEQETSEHTRESLLSEAFSCVPEVTFMEGSGYLSGINSPFGTQGLIPCQLGDLYHIFHSGERYKESSNDPNTLLPDQQDAMLVYTQRAEGYLPAQSGLVLAVADGVGGSQEGAQASHGVLESLYGNLKANQPFLGACENVKDFSGAGGTA